MTRSALALLALLVPACAATVHKLPGTALSYGEAHVGAAAVRVDVRPVSDATWVSGHDPETLVRWRERPLYAALRGAPPSDRTLFLPLVPRPSLEITITNDADQPLSLARATIEVGDDSGVPYRLARSSKDFLPDLLGPAMLASPALWLQRLEWGPVEQWPDALTHWQGPEADGPVGFATAIRKAAEGVPLLGPDVTVPAHGTWRGALVFDTDAGSGDALAARLRGSLYVRWSGATLGDAPAPPLLVTLPLAAAPRATACIEPSVDEQGSSYRGLAAPPMSIDGMAVTRTDVHGEELALPASAEAARRAHRMRIAGDVLIGTGVLGAVAAPAGIAIEGHGREAPAGIASLAVAGVGAILNYVGYKHERAAQAQFNAYASATGVCAAPR